MDRTAWLLILAAAAFVAGIGLLFAGVDDEAPTAATTTTTTLQVEPTTTQRTETTETRPEATTGARFVEGRCEFDEPPGYQVDCGWLVAPEDRSDPANGKTVRLHVAIFRSQVAGVPEDPIVYLEGGPGGDALEAVPFTFAQAFAPFLESRDFIMFDQRGTGFSSPSLACPETVELAFEQLDLDLDLDEALAQELAALEECHTRIVEEAELSLYNSEASAADLADLRVVLGYEEWNLFGISYGTRLALTTMRDHPEGIRSVILDSTYPPQVSLPLEVGLNAARAFTVFFDACAEDPECSGAFPDLEARFFALVDALDAEPIMATLLDVFTLEEHDALVEGDALLGLLFQSLYSSELIPVLPGLIDDVENGDYQSLELLLSNFFANIEFISTGQTFAVQCREELPFTDPAELATAGDFDPYIKRIVESGGSTGPFALEVCELWDVGTADALENEPVASDIPTLVLAGEFDPITPPSWGVLAAETLANASFFEFPGLGHGTSVSDECALSIALEFLNDPSAEPDGSCVSAMSGPDFITGDEPAAEIRLVPVTVESFGATIDTLVPDDWSELGSGVYLRGASGLDQTALLFQAVGGNQANLLLTTLTAQLGADADDVTSREYNSGPTIWGIHTLEVEGVATDIAITETNGYTVLVLLASDSVDREAYQASILLPILDALEVR
ncbi:MAG TPA: alpha/beta fold hydrolase [Acidimicrobiia bacterium]|nr:alpha/beta fold hydrolase [Acidimicrobiia bacterium]